MQPNAPPLACLVLVLVLVSFPQLTHPKAHRPPKALRHHHKA
jgi:hypothetical protein